MPPAEKNTSISSPPFPLDACLLSCLWSNLTSLAQPLRHKASSWRLNTAFIRTFNACLQGRQQSLSTSPWQGPAMGFSVMSAPFNLCRAFQSPGIFDCSPKSVASLVVKEIWGQMVWNWNHIIPTLSQMLACCFSKSPQSSVAFMLVWWRSAS